MSLKEADQFFQETIKKGKEFAVFSEPNEAIDAAKQMIDLVGNNVKITIPFLENGTINEINAPISKEVAKQYISNYDGEDGGGVYQRSIDFSKKETPGRSMWIETYKRIGGSYDAVDILSWG